MATSQQITRKQIVEWHNNIKLTKLEPLVVKGVKLQNLIPDSSTTVRTYLGAYENAVRDIFGALHVSAGSPYANLQSIVDDTEKKLDETNKKFEKALDDAQENRNLGEFKENAYSALLDMAALVFEVREKTMVYRLAGEEVEPESISAYVDRLLERAEKAAATS